MVEKEKLTITILDKNKPSSDNDDLNTIDVSEALGLGNGIVKVKGIIISKSEIYRSPYGRNAKCTNKNCKLNLLELPLSRLGETNTKSWQQEATCRQCNSRLWSVPYYAKHTTISIIDKKPGKSRVCLRVKLVDELIKDISLGKIATIRGNMYTVKKNNITQLLADSIEICNSHDDRADIQEKLINSKSLDDSNYADLDNLANSILPRVIGLNPLKKALLLCLANSNNRSTSPDCFDDRIHILLMGNQMEVSVLLRYLSDLSDGIFVDANTIANPVTVEVLTQNKTKILNCGYVVLANGSILSVDHIEKLKKREIGYLEQAIKFGSIDVKLQGFEEIIQTNPTLIVSTNYNDRAQRCEIYREFSQNFDLVYECKSPKEISIQDLSNGDTDSEVDKKYQLLKERLKKARTMNPKLSNKAIIRISEYCNALELTAYKSIAQFNIKLTKFALAIARWNQENIAGENEVNQAIQLIESLRLPSKNEDGFADQKVRIAMECVDILRTLEIAIIFDELIDLACQVDERTKLYLGEKRKMSNNYKVKCIAQIIKEQPNIEIIRQKPLELKLVL